MKRSLVVTLSAALLMLSGTTANADDGRNPRGGAASGPQTPAEVAGAAAKDAAIQALLAGMSAFPSVSSRPDASIQTLPPDCTDCAVARGSLYQEPQAINGVNYAANWCGPGTTTALASGWKYKNLGYDDIPGTSRSSNPDGYGYRTFSGATAFMQHLAYDLDEVRYYSTGQPISEPSTNIGDEDTNESGVANSANAYAGYTFYYVNPNASLSTFRSYLRGDIGVYEVPLSLIVQVCPIGLNCLHGWTGGGSDIMHWVTAGAYDMGTDLITYGDSAGPNQSYGQNPYGWHDRGITELYNSYMLGFGRAAVVF